MNVNSYTNNIKDLVASYKDTTPNKPFVYSFVIHKGGTGKSTLTGLCSSITSSKNLSVLVIDLDHSKNITHSMTSALGDLSLDDYGNVYDLLKNDELDFQQTIPVNDNLHLLAGAYNSSELENEAMLLFRLREAIEKHYSHYDLIFIDTHADFGLRSRCALVASDAFSAPLELSNYSALNLGTLLDDYNNIRKRVNKDLFFQGFIVNRVDQFDNSLGRKVPKKLSQRKLYKEIEQFCGDYKETHGKNVSIVGMLGSRDAIGSFSTGISLAKLEKDSNAYAEALEVVQNILKLMVEGE